MPGVTGAFLCMGCSAEGCDGFGAECNQCRALFCLHLAFLLDGASVCCMCRGGEISESEWPDWCFTIVRRPATLVV